MRRASLGSQHPALHELAGQAEVNDLEAVVFYGLLGSEKKGLGLQVPVCNLVLVHIVHGTDDLLHHTSVKLPASMMRLRSSPPLQSSMTRYIFSGLRSSRRV